MRALEQMPDLPLVGELGPTDEREVLELLAAFVASGGVGAWTVASERVRRALVLGWVNTYSTHFLVDRVAMRLYTRLVADFPGER